MGSVAATTASALESPTVFVVIGVSGSGKTTIAALLAERLGVAFEEGDDLHPQSNLDKMAAGHPLDDDDRMPWLARVREWIESRLDAGESGVITCSALKRSYRELLNRRGAGVVFVYLRGDESTFAERLSRRTGHFMPPSLLGSQFAALEEPGEDEPAILVDAAGTPEQIVAAVLRELPLAARQPKRPEM